MGRRARFTVAACLLLACGGDDANPQDTDGGGTEGSSGRATTRGNSGNPSSTDPQDDDDSPTTADDSSSGGPPITPGNPAGGIHIEDVEINQGVGITLSQGGIVVPIESRSAPVIGGRDALVRVGYSLDADFAPHAIEARLWLGDQAFVNVHSVNGPPVWDTLEGTINFFVDGDALGADTTLRIELLEVDGGPTQGTVGNSTFGGDDGTALGVWADPMQLDIMLVPYTCDGYPALEITDEKLANFEAFLFNTYPVQSIELTVHEPVHSATCSEFDAAEFELPALREADGAAPWVYYGALLPGEGGGYSIATQGGDLMDYRRTFANHAWRDEGLTADLFAHELGHNHGRDHSFEDPSFPTETGPWCGPRSTYGWGPRSASMPTSGFSNDVALGLTWFDPNANILSPTDTVCDVLADGNRYNYNDIMSYTYPFWVSAYTYAAAAERIRLISSWREQGLVPPQGRTARLIVGPDGALHRTTFAGSHTVTEPQTWAVCGDARVPVRITHSALERLDTHGKLQRKVFTGYELPIDEIIDPSTCILDVEGLRVPLAIE